MRHIDRCFLCLGVVAALVGLSMGVWMHVRESYTLYAVHAHVNLVGWVTMTLFGLAYRTGLAPKDRWAAVHFAISVGAVAALPTGMLVAMLGGTRALVHAGVILTVGSMVLFAANVVRGFGVGEARDAVAPPVRRPIGRGAPAE